VVAGADAGRGQMVGEPVGPLVEGGVGQPPITADERLALGDGVDDDLEDVGQVALHGRHSSKAAGRASYSPFQVGVRFSRKAQMPSWASPVMAFMVITALVRS
jgi:hypothetical protein